MEPVWRELPEDILESNVLPCLPVQSLCRFRAVCKKWNTFIARADFAGRHAIASPAEMFVLISLRTELPLNALGGWDILDVANNKVFPLSGLQSFLAMQARPRRMDGEHKKVLAADGGLMLVWYSMAESNPNHVLLVCNPILRVMRVIPSLPGWVHTHDYDCVVMSTDRASMEYEIVVLHPLVYHYQVRCIDVFESKTGVWKRVVNPTVPSEGRWLSQARFVKFRTSLYRLYRRGSDMKPCLVEFDKSTSVGTLSILPELIFGVRVDMKVLELVVSQDRLFCLSKWRISRNQYRFIEIFEIFPERRECKLVAKLPSEVLKWLNGDELYGAWYLKGIMVYYFDPIVATGCESSILFCSCMGRSVGYNLVDKSWRPFSSSNMLRKHLHFTGFGYFGRYLQCSNLGLSLCPP